MPLLLLILGVLAQAAPALAQANWLYLGGGGEGVKRVGQSIDINSGRLLPNGVTSYAWRVEVVNPITLQNLYVERAAGIDCKTMEIVDLTTGERAPLDKQRLADQVNTASAYVAVRNFCPLAQPKTKK